LASYLEPQNEPFCWLVHLCYSSLEVREAGQPREGIYLAAGWSSPTRHISYSLLANFRLSSPFRQRSHFSSTLPEDLQPISYQSDLQSSSATSQLAIFKIDRQVRDLHLRYSNCLKPTHGAILDRTTFEYNTVDYPSCVAASCRRCSRTILPFLGIATSRKHCPIFF